MKSKSVVYILGFSVLCIWGIIIYRIWLSVNDGTDKELPAGKAAAFKKAGVPKLYPDTSKLLLDYPDPFTGMAITIADTSKKKSLSKLQLGTEPPIPAPVPEVNPVEQIKYLGYVTNGAGNKRVAIMSFQGTEKMMKEGDTNQRIQLIAIKKDAVVLKYKGKTTLIKTD